VIGDAGVVQVNVTCVRVVVSCAPTPEHRDVPEALKSRLACAEITPKFAVFFIHRVNSTVELAGIAPATPGTPVSVSQIVFPFRQNRRPAELEKGTATGRCSDPASRPLVHERSE
jgi:hypothetical protein